MMSTAQELFRFVTLRRPERVRMHRLNNRLIRDPRPADASSLLVQLFGPGPFEPKLSRANTFAASADFVDSDDLTIQILDRAADFFRDVLKPRVTQAEMIEAFVEEYPLLARLLKANPSPEHLEATAVFIGRVWDSLYAQAIRACDQYTTTNYLADALRVYHILRILWLLKKLKIKVWPGGAFDDYDILIDLDKAQAGGTPDDRPPVDRPWTVDPERIDRLQHQLKDMLLVDEAKTAVDGFVNAGSIRVNPDVSPTAAVLDDDAVRALKDHPALKGMDLATTPVNTVVRTLKNNQQLASMQVARLQTEPMELQTRRQLDRSLQDVISTADHLSNPRAVKNPVSISPLAASFYVPLSVGEHQPPIVGDLLLVEQELNRYEMGEIAEIENVLKSERKERSTRQLSRTSQTTTTEVSSEREETESQVTDERFTLKSEAQKTASQSLSFEAGVNVSGKFGPVQVSASASASFSSAQSTSQSTSQEYAKTVTEEATKRVLESFKETNSITLLTESQTTSLHGVNNEGGTDHIIGIYRWVDKYYTARLMNYGRRLMLRLEVPEPAAFFRSLMTQDEAALLEDLTEPVHPTYIDKISGPAYPGGQRRAGGDQLSPDRREQLWHAGGAV